MPATFAEIFASELQSHETAVSKLHTCLPVLEQISDCIIHALRSGNKIIFLGNGGSAADSQHLAAELVIRFRTNRRSLPSLALTTDTSMLTACGNDYGFDTIFARQIEGLAAAGDVVIGITTSGNSANVIAGLERANERGCVTIAWTAESGGRAAEVARIAFKAPTPATSHAQECHMIVGHILCEMVDRAFT